jgi:ribosome-binding protein aMBF1 (putative translation factor)
MSEQPYCEICGENHATIQGSECGYCDECYQVACRQAIYTETGRNVCGQVLRYGCEGNPNLAVCIEPYGTKHDHGE